MVQHDYNQPISQPQQAEMPKFSKKDEQGLPYFTKEVPLRTIMKQHKDSITIEYEWSILGGEEIKISMAHFRNEDNLQNVHAIRIKDGSEVGFFKIGNATYIIRRTTENMAKELMKTTGKIKASIIGVIGYLKTMKGNYYSISKVDGDAWSLDMRTGLKQFALSSMGSSEKRRLTDFVIDELLKLYKQGYALKDFSLLDVIVTKKKIVLGNATALVKVSAAKTVDNFMANLKVLVKNNVAEKGDVVYGIALSFGAMKNEYKEWMQDKNVPDQEDIELLEKIEADIFRSE